MFIIDRAKLEASGIPSYMHGGVIRYFESGIPPGHFLSAVLNNDLKEAISRADAHNMTELSKYVIFFYNNAPAGSWGHANATRDWYKKFEKVSFIPSSGESDAN